MVLPESLIYCANELLSACIELQLFSARTIFRLEEIAGMKWAFARLGRVTALPSPPSLSTPMLAIDAVYK